jgi:hypothetical protein
MSIELLIFYKGNKMSIVLDLKKSLDNVCLKKGLPENIRLQVRLAIDVSSSMYSNYSNGWMDIVVNAFIAAGLRFDDDKEIQVGMFNDKFMMLPSANEQNYKSYLRDNNVNTHGGTEFLPIFEEFSARNLSSESPFGFIKKLFSKSSKKKYDPVYLAVLTDGDSPSDDAFKTKYTIQMLANEDIFIQFIGIGKGINKKWLNQLDEYNHNVSSIYLDKLPIPEPTEFYELLCNEKFVTWATNTGK